MCEVEVDSQKDRLSVITIIPLSISLFHNFFPDTLSHADINTTRDLGSIHQIYTTYSFPPIIHWVLHYLWGSIHSLFVEIDL
ncbi:hypothetical protein L1887_16040 [Cichorium endivia]|nr:hypothetical protein L1887_16040 [Cichorium endivia]